jgi:hypothetical protein
MVGTFGYVWGAVMPKSSKVYVRASTPKVDIQHVADTAARSALDQFANSPARKEELHKIMTAAIAGTLEKFGLDPDDKASVEKFRANMIHLNTWREFTELVKVQGVGAAVSWLTKGLLIVLALGVVALFGKHLSGN